MPLKYRNILFDLDGTIVDSSLDIIACVRAAFSEVSGGSESPEVSPELIGLQLREILLGMEPGMGEERQRALAAAFRRIYDGSGFPATKLYPGARRVLEGLRDAGADLFVVTNKPSRPTADIVNKFGLEMFKAVICPDSLGGDKMSKNEMVKYVILKWALIPAKTVMVGDAEPDLQAASGNGIHAVAVLYGYGNTGRLMALKPELFINSLSELPGLVYDD